MALTSLIPEATSTTVLIEFVLPVVNLPFGVRQGFKCKFGVIPQSFSHDQCKQRDSFWDQSFGCVCSSEYICF